MHSVVITSLMRHRFTKEKEQRHKAKQSEIKIDSNNKCANSDSSRRERMKKLGNNNYEQASSLLPRVHPHFPLSGSLSVRRHDELDKPEWGTRERERESDRRGRKWTILA